MVHRINCSMTKNTSSSQQLVASHDNEIIQHENLVALGQLVQDIYAAST